jgi:hypothetical protein
MKRFGILFINFTDKKTIDSNSSTTKHPSIQIQLCTECSNTANASQSWDVITWKLKYMRPLSSLEVEIIKDKLNLRMCLLRFQIHRETKMIQFLLRNDSRSNQNHFVKSIGVFVKTFWIQLKWEESESKPLETPILSFHSRRQKSWNIMHRFNSAYVVLT